MLNRIRNSKLTRYFSAFLALELIVSLVPSTALALTSGPSQPEVQSFEPIATTDMVDPFTGDFNYNVPLMQVGNYPINIFYHAGNGMDDEASSVGLGWNINPGNLTRNMRGLPDDFKGDEIVTEQKVRPNNTYKVDLGLNAEILGIDMENIPGMNFGVYYNNYKGIGYSVGIGLNLGCFSTNIGFDNQSGFDVDLSLEADLNKKDKSDKLDKKLGASIGYNSRGGLSGLTLKYSANKDIAIKSKNEAKQARISSKYGKFHAGGSLGSSISFATQTYTPNFTPWMYNTSISLGVKLGGEISGSSYKGKIGVSFSTNYLKFKKSVHKGLGYIYSGSKSSIDGDISLDEDEYKYFGVLMDFNRDRESDINRKTRWLHTTNFTYDVYSAAGQGVSGFFRPYRNSVGNVSDPTNVVHNWSNTGVTAEFAVGNLFLAGADVSVGTYNGRSESWLDQDNLSALSSDLAFSDAINSSDPLDEPFYFKMAGEKSVNDDAFYNQIMDDKAVKIPLENKGKLEARFVADGDDRDITTQIKRNERDKRSQAITYLTAAEANRFGLDKSPKYYTYDSNGNELTEFLNRIDESAGRKKHHLSEITVINPDGTRYVYGIAAYNTEQSDYTFSVSENTSNPQNISYESDDITLDNNKGRDKYFKKQTTPPYAHTYLLTAVLSPDYIDVSGNGPTEDDMGTYTKINYTRLYSDYAWRTPFGVGQASYNRGMISEGGDDKASIIFGKKEIWYVHSIESKTQIAKFYYSNRADSYGANGIGGGINSNRPLKKIDSITLYSKTDVNTNGFDEALPIKTVHFTYDYSLCKGLPNNLNSESVSTFANSGKLTLKSFYFTYGFNTSGASNQYKFEYGKNAAGVEKNSNYTEKYTDRWGNYKAPQTSGTATLKPWEHPYTEQNSSTANDNARMWNLTKIELPSGGIIRPTYEADDYKYVQDKKAMYMARVIGISDHADIIGDDQLYYTAGLDFNQNNFLHIQLPSACTYSQLEEHLKDIPQLYFTFKVNLKKYDEPEIITGYAEVVQFGLQDGDNTKAWIKVKLVEENGRDVNPFSVAAWQYMRNMRPDLAYPGSDTNTDGFQAMDIVMMMVGSLQELFGTIAGIRTRFMMQRNAQLVDLNQCFVRIKCRDTGDDAGKIGGGYRISAIDFEDNWDVMTSSSEPKANYGQIFEYKLVDGTTSGVAAYEPGIGGDENSNRVPLPLDDEDSNNPTVSVTKTPLGPDDRFYVDGPVGEQFYPSPTVGYSRVIIRNKKPSGSLNLTRHGTGKIVHEFYTAKDFPVITDSEGIDTRFSEPFGIMSLLGVVSTNWGTASQGFSITTNDMHGKPRSISVYAETADPESLAEDALISRTEYFYKQDGNKLVNDALTINKDGTIQEKSIGKEIEVVVDTKHKRDISINAGIKLNLDAFLLGPFPVPVPTGFPDFQYTENDIRYAVCTKVVQRYGVLESTRVTENGSTLTTRNVLWDAETGEVLLTETQNEHNDNTYNLTLPSHWAYDGMGPAYKNINAQGFMVLNCLEGSTTMELSDNSGIAHTLANDVFFPGDEVMLIPTVDGEPVATSLGLKAWVLDTIKGTGSERISFIDQYGAPAVAVTSSEEGDKTYFYKIIRSGRRNQQSLPVGSFISRNKPYTVEGESVLFPMGQDGSDVGTDVNRWLNFNVDRAIINASATEYSDKWQLFNGVTYDTDEYYSCSQKDAFSVPYFFNYLLNTFPFENNGSEALDPVDSRLKNFISAYTGEDTVVMRYNFLSDDVLRMIFTNSWEVEEEDPEFCQAYLYLKPLDNYQPFINGNYFNDIVYFSAGGYITPAEKTYYDTNALGYYLLTAHTSTGNCFRFIAYAMPGTGACVNFDDNECDNHNFVTCNGQIDACAPQAANTTYAAKTINPYQKSVRGIWRPLRSHAYNSSRNYLGNYLAGTTTTNIRFDGTYKDFTPFWTPSTQPNKDWVRISPSAPGKWVWTEEVTKVSPYGFDVENKDALNRYSGAVYGYFNSLPIITGGNAKYCELAYDGFEDYDFPPILLLRNACLPKDHFSFNDVVTSANIANVAHTGSKSLKVSPTDNFTAVRYLTKPPVAADPNDDFMLRYKVQPEDTLPLFSPREGKYVISAWAKDMGGTYANTSISVEVYDNTDNVSLGSYTLYAQTSQPLIEGWKRMEGTFVIDPLPSTPTHDVEIRIRPINGNTSADVYFDDIRIHPFNSMAKSYVYDPIRLRLIAQLDENNYATFYEYDEQGNLVRTKRETERGVMTIQENRQNIKKQ